MNRFASITKPKLLAKRLCFQGTLSQFSHESESCQGSMRFTVYVPPSPPRTKFPVLYWAPGYEWNDLDFFSLTGANEMLSKLGLMVVSCDSKVRDPNLPYPQFENDQPFSMYINSTTEAMKRHQMFQYLTEELPYLVQNFFPTQIENQSIFGSSTGGTAALLCGLKLPSQYKSISAFRPFSKPTASRLGQKFFEIALGNDVQGYQEWDPTYQVQFANESISCPLIDQGSNDEFLVGLELRAENLREAFKQSQKPITLRLRTGYDHTHFFISSFMKDHLIHHSSALTPK